MSNDEQKDDAVDGDETVLKSLQETIRFDRAAGRIRPTSEYLRHFPGQDEVLASALATDPGATVLSEGRAPRSEPSEHVGRYRVLRELGRGGQAVVYLAEDAELGRRVALKVLSTLGPSAPGVMERFRREAEVTSRLAHPGICAVYEVGTEPVPFIAMRLVEGESLAQEIRAASTAAAEDPTSVSFVSFDTTTATGGETATGRRAGDDAPQTRRSGAELAGILLPIEKAARALHAAHEAGIVHRDVKPATSW